MEVVQQDGLLLRFAAQSLCDNRSIVIASLTNNQESFNFVSTSLQADLEIQRLAGQHRALQADGSDVNEYNSEEEDSPNLDEETNSSTPGTSRKRPISHSIVENRPVQKRRRSNRLIRNSGNKYEELSAGQAS